MSDKTILIVGTYDTKDDELSYLADRIRQMGGGVVTMDVSVLGEPSSPCDLSKYDVALAGDSTIQAAIDTGEENLAMQIMARGAARLTADLHAEGRIDGVIVLGGTMGTDLALDVCQALPLGIAKYIVSNRVLFPSDSGGTPVPRYPDDLVGRWSLRPQFSLQILAQSGGWRCAWGRTRGGKADIRSTGGRHDFTGVIRSFLHETAQTGP